MFFIVRFFGQLYNEGMNKERTIKLIEILRRYTDMDHKLSIAEISSLLEAEGLKTVERKTLYDDFRNLELFGYDVEYDGGYYLSEAPFSVSEVKIIVDSINSLKNLDDRFLIRLKEKLYSFLSIYEEKDLKKIEYRSRHRDAHFINRLEDALEAIRKEKMLSITRTGKKKAEEIVPLFLYRENDYYYLYYHYPQSEKIYHARFDNITAASLLDQSDDVQIPINRILSNIEESTSSFHSAESRTLTFEIFDDSDYLRRRLQDDFASLVFTKNGFSARVSISEAFFARLASYGDSIKISDPEIAERYVDYLNRIITRNTSARRSRR